MTEKHTPSAGEGLLMLPDDPLYPHHSCAVGLAWDLLGLACLGLFVALFVVLADAVESGAFGGV